MNANELLLKLNDANERVGKRLNTIKKLCVKAGIDYDELLKRYSDNKSSRYAVALSIVNSFVDTTDLSYYEPAVQLIDNLPKLFEVESIADTWRVKYETQLNKENAPKIEAIWDFLCDWEKGAVSWYIHNANLYFKLKCDYNKAYAEYVASDKYKKMLDLYGSRRVEQKFDDKYYSSITKLAIDIARIKYICINGECVPDSCSIDLPKIEKIIAEEKLRKYDDLCNRISAVVGEIIDCSNLSIGNQNGELNGIVVGSKASAKIETISAGGYNIQCFHYRVLVNCIKK